MKGGKNKVKKDTNKEGKITKQVRKNPWIGATFVLGVACLIFIIGMLIPEEVIETTVVVETDGNICKYIKTTPSWVNERGQIQEGYIDLTQSNVSEVVDTLITERVYFVWNVDCELCGRQITEFGDSWIKYFNSGYTINC